MKRSSRFLSHACDFHKLRCELKKKPAGVGGWIIQPQTHPPEGEALPKPEQHTDASVPGTVLRPTLSEYPVVTGGGQSRIV